MVSQKESRRIIGTFALASFLNDLGSDMIYPVWPLFVTTVLNANMSVLGFLDGLGDAILSISQGISGYLSDRIRKRKAFIWIGYLFGSLSRFGYSVSTAWQQLIPLRILDRGGKIRSAPRDAIIADITMRETRGGIFGFLRAMDNLGAVCGVVVCILFFKFLGYRKLFMLAVIPSLISMSLILIAIKERKRDEIKMHEGIALRDLDFNFKFFLLLSSLFALGSFSYSFLLIYATRFGFRTTSVPVLYLIFTAAASLTSIPFGRLSDKIGRKKVLILSYILWGLVCLSFISLHSFFAILLTFFLYGLHKGSLEPVQRSFVSELSPIEYRASGLGLYQMVMGICALPASMIAGLLWDKIDIRMPFYFSLILTVFSTILLLFVKEKG